MGYAYQINTRTNTRRSFSIYANGDQTQISNFGLLRLDVLLQPGTWYLQDNGVNYGLELREPDASTAQFDSRLLNHAFYGKLDGSLTDALSFDLGVRWEYAKESTILRPIASRRPRRPTSRTNTSCLRSPSLTRSSPACRFA